jgi:HAD superfamily hydrolase (TIGR01549 family)
MPTLKAVLFDLDDTLIDWSKFDGNYYQMEMKHFNQLHAYFSGKGYPLPHVDKMLDRFRGQAMAAWENGRETMVAPHLPTILIELLRSYDIADSDLVEQVVIEQYAWGKVEGTTVFPEVPETLEVLLAAGIQIGIVTNAFQPMVMRDRELAEHDLLRYFKTCRFAAADVGYLKPHPAIFEAALACVGTEPAETVFVGDNLNADIVGAQRLGLKAVWRDTGYHSSRVSRDTIEPDATIKRLDQLLPNLDRWYDGWRPA